MRIIAGEFRGRVLLAPPTEATRPITDRAKQSLFDTLGGWMEGARVLDAFAGTGSMGLECLSRGASSCVFVERGAACEPLRRNIETLGVGSRSLVLPIDAYRIAQHSSIVGPDVAPLDLAFIDPPYAHTEPGPHYKRLLRLLRDLAASALAPGAGLVLRHPTRVDVSSLVPEPFLIARELTYGSMRISLIEAPWGDS